MVAIATPRFGYIVEPNLSRTFLHRALLAQEAGNLIQAGVLLREAVRRQLYAECNWKGCLPSNKWKHKSASSLLIALKKAGHVGEGGVDCTLGIIDIGNRAAHCARVSVDEIRCAIAMWHYSIDNDPCGEEAIRVDHCKPVEKCCDDWDDDDDGANWWKQGGGV